MVHSIFRKSSNTITKEALVKMDRIVYFHSLTSCIVRMYTKGWSSLENEVADEWIE